MTRSPIWQRIGRWAVMSLTASGGSMYLLSGCDPEVQGVVLSGFQDLAVTFVDAFFLTIQPEEEAVAGTLGGS
jgi:hypothetical protein